MSDGDNNWVDLGSKVYAKFFTCSHRTDPSGAIIRFGGELEDAGYDRDDICCGSITWCKECRPAGWELHSLDPLHVEPSVETTCHKHPKHHGFIRNGQWVDC